MLRRRSFLFAIVLGLPISTISQAEKPSKPSAQVLAAITMRGKDLADYDNAASHASDAVQEVAKNIESVHRYIARKVGNGWTVDFGRLNNTKDAFLVSYEAVQSGEPGHFQVSHLEPAREDKSWDLAAAIGIELVLRDFHGANRPYNIAVLPGDSGDMFVYLYLAQVTPGVYPYGADARYRVSGDGKTILEKRQLHKSVIEIPPGDSTQDQTVGAYHVHVLTDLPEDTDVLLVLARSPKVPEFVGAGGLVFKIDVNGSITIIGKTR